MTSMKRETDRLRLLREANRKKGRIQADAARARNKALREAETVANETLAERRERLQLQLEIAESLTWAESQAVMLREALGELPPPGACAAWRWGDFRVLLEAPTNSQQTPSEPTVRLFSSDGISAPNPEPCLYCQGTGTIRSQGEWDGVYESHAVPCHCVSSERSGE